MSSFDERREARAAWEIRRLNLGDEPLSDPRDESTTEERLTLVWRLTRELWAFANLAIPKYERAEMPGRIIRPE